MLRGHYSSFLAGALLSSLLGIVYAQDTLGLKDGYLNISIANFNVKLVKDSQTLASLQPTDSTFDFSPFDYLSQRAANGNYHIGDLTFHYRLDGASSWTDGNTASARASVTALKSMPPGVLAASNLAPTFNQTVPVSITRQWMDMDGDLALSFTLTNMLNQTLEIGSLGFPIEFNSIFTNRPATDVEIKCSLQDPYIGLDAGYVQVTPVQGTGPALVVSGLNSSSFEAWRFLSENTRTALAYQSQVFEGYYEWQVHTKAWAENEWKNVVPWNVPTSKTLLPNQSMTVGLRFSLAKDGIRAIETTVKSLGMPYAVSVPGYIVPQDTSAKLFISSASSVSNITVNPVGAFDVTSGMPQTFTLQASTSTWGRARVTVTYSDGRSQALHYNIIKSAPTTISDLGNFLTTAQWFNDTSDPFHRAPSVISYDRSVNKKVLQDPRVWIAGLSDEAGAGSWLAACMKQSVQPNPAEITLLEEFIDTTMWGVLQINNGSTVFDVRKSVFFYEPARVLGYNYNSTINWSGSWNYAEAYSVSRAYDYVHVSAAYWALYRVARAYPSLVSLHTYDWYLKQAYQTVMACTAVDENGNYLIGYADDGLMEETVWGEILQDLYRENQTSNAQALEARMEKRAQHWDSIAVPFGSEMAWDSTGQEGVYYWTNHFGLTSTATKTINSILGYMPTVGHWGWNGNARRYWDNLYGGQLERIERQIHHYGSGLNALPLLNYFRSNPSDTYILRVGFGGMYGPLSNIDHDGFASASFHSWPDTLRWDYYSGDYGPNFLGLVLNSGLYLVQDPELGLVAFGGDLVGNGSAVTITPRDAVRRRVYIAQFGTFVEMDAGVVQKVDVDLVNSKATFTLAQGVGGAAAANATVVWVSTPAVQRRVGNMAVTTGGLAKVRGGWQVSLTSAGGSFAIGKA